MENDIVVGFYEQSKLQLAIKFKLRPPIQLMSKFEDARKNGSILINSLIEYTQRCELAAFDKKRMLIKYRDSAKNPKVAELLATQSGIFLIKENQILKSDSQFFKFENAKNEDLMKATAPENNQTTKQLEINPKIFELLKRELGEFEILL